MSRRTSAARLFAATALVVVISVATLAGCAAKTPTAGSTDTPTASGTAAPPSTPTPTPTPTFVAQKYTCQNILPPATLAVFTDKAADGFTLQKDYAQRVHNFDATLSLFDDYRGILCQWAYEGATKSVDYGFSPITADQAKAVQSTLVKNGYAPTAKDNGIVYVNADPANFPDTYLFIDGYWFYASQSSLLDLIVENVFQAGE